MLLWYYIMVFGRGHKLAFLTCILSLTLPLKNAFGAPAASPAPAQAVPQPQIQWVDASGEIVKVPWRVRSQWTWEKFYRTDPVKRPLLRTWVEIPAGVFVQGVKTTAARLDQAPTDSPFDKSDLKVLAIDVISPLATVTVKYNSAQGRIQESTLLLQLSFDKTALWINPTCISMGLNVVREKGDASFLYTAVNCEEVNETKLVYVLYPGDANIDRTTIPNRNAGGSGWSRFDVKKAPEKPEESSKPGDPNAPPKEPTDTDLGMFSVASKEKGEAIEYRLVQAPPKPTRKFFKNFGLAVTHFSYKESPGGIKLTQIGITGKVSASYQLKPNKWDLGGNAFITLLPVTHSPSNLDAARFYGINGRLGYRLPGKFLDADWSILGGWYFWGMLVPGNSYGLSSLSGPQIFFFMRKVPSGRKAYFSYLKFAPIFESPSSFSLSNRELAVGGGYQISPLNAQKHWFMTLDIADARFKSATVTNSMSLLTISLGVQREF